MNELLRDELAQIIEEASGHPPQQATTEWWPDLEWRNLALEGLLPSGAANRLSDVDRALYGLKVIAEMLVKDERGRSHAESGDGIHFKGLHPHEAEGLGLALLELAGVACEKLGRVRENHLGHLKPLK